MPKKVKVKKNIKRRKKFAHDLSRGSIYIQSSFNNTIVTLADCAGNVLARESAGSLGFKGTKKSTPYAATMIAKALGQKAYDLKIPQYFVYICGVGSGRDSAIRALTPSAAMSFFALITDCIPFDLALTATPAGLSSAA